MTYREMMERDNPRHCGKRFIGGCEACPGDWYPGGPTENKQCLINDPAADSKTMERGCAACWDQEVRRMIDPKKAPVVYIAGPITGVKDYWKPFCETRWELVREGMTRVLDPTTLPEGMTTEQYMRICFAMIDTADAVLLLPGWQESNGATVESVYCRYIGKPTYDSVEALVEAWR